MRRALRCLASSLLALAWAASAGAEPATETPDLAALVARVESDVRDFRRDLHAHPELSNRELRTAKAVAAKLRRLGYEVRTEVAHTGVIGVLRGPPGPVVALRADMDALPVTEETGLPFASKQRAVHEGREVGVMHACGHDLHTSILIGVAGVLAELRGRLGGSALLLFQPAEEGAPKGERGGAELMLEEGAFAAPKPDAVFALHVTAELPVGQIGVRAGAATASSDRLDIRVKGRQSHAASPWQGVDPIAAAARIVLALEALPAREVDVRIPSVVSIGAIHGGVRHNIIPEDVLLMGTIRSLDRDQRAALHEKVRRTVAGIAQASGAEAEVAIDQGNPMVWNDPALLARMRPALERAAGTAQVAEMPPWTSSEDFAFYAERVPGLFFWLGVRRPGVAETDAAQIHTPRFDPDEAALPLGVRALSELAVSFLNGVR